MPLSEDIQWLLSIPTRGAGRSIENVQGCRSYALLFELVMQMSLSAMPLTDLEGVMDFRRAAVS